MAYLIDCYERVQQETRPGLKVGTSEASVFEAIQTIITYYVCVCVQYESKNWTEVNLFVKLVSYAVVH